MEETIPLKNILYSLPSHFSREAGSARGGALTGRGSS